MHNKDCSFIGSCYRSRERSVEYSVVIPTRVEDTEPGSTVVGLDYDPLTNSLLFVNNYGLLSIMPEFGVQHINLPSNRNSCKCMKFFTNFRIALIGMKNGFYVFDPRIDNGMSFVSIYT